MSFCKKKIKKKYRISKVLVPVPDVYYMFIKCIFVRVHQVRRVTVLFVCLSVCLLTTRLSHRYYQKTIYFFVVCARVFCSLLFVSSVNAVRAEITTVSKTEKKNPTKPIK